MTDNDRITPLQPSPAADLVLREATPADVPAITDVVNRAYRVEDAFVVGDRTDPEAVAALLAVPGGVFLLAEHAGDPVPRPAGAVFVRVRGERGYVGPLAVAPEQQGRGLGKVLVRAAEAYCRARGCRHLDLDVLDVRPELIVFYRSLGFAPCGSGDYPEPERLRCPVRLVLMTKAL